MKQTDSIFKIRTIMKEWSKGYIGKSEDLEMILCAILNNGHILLEGPPGTGKTKLASAISQSVGGTFNRIQFTPDILPSDITGINFFHPGTKQFEIKKGPLFTNILLADEINRATPKTQSALLQAMQESEVTIDNATYPLPSPFMVIATQNNVEQSQGTYQLPQAQMDRFMIMLEITHPSIEDEMKIVSMSFQQKVDQILETPHELIVLKNNVNHIFIHEDILKYIVLFLHKTRTHPSLNGGLSSRTGLQLRELAQAMAYINDRDFVIPDDVIKIIPYAVLHKLIFKERNASVIRKREIIMEIVGELDVPNF